MVLRQGDTLALLVPGVSLLILGMERGLRWLVRWTSVTVRMGRNAASTAMGVVVVDSVALWSMLAQNRHCY